MNYLHTGQSDDRAEESAEGNWILSYADMMTMLLCFFIMLYSFAKTDKSKFDGFARELTEAFKGQVSKEESREEGSVQIAMRDLRAMQMLVSVLNLGESLDSALPKVQDLLEQASTRSVVSQVVADAKDEISTLGASVSESILSYELVLPADILFASGSADLKKSAKDKLIVIGERLASIDGLIALEIIGHTDSQPLSRTSPYFDNFALSAIRAAQVAKVFSSAGLSAEKLKISGMGALDPVAPETGIADSQLTKNREKNRRVHLVVRKVK